MENASNEFIRLIRDRLKYPIATLYAIILIIYNWDVLSVFFLSTTNIEKRIVYINENFKDPDYNRLWMPLVKAIFYFILAPLIMLILEFSIKTVNKFRRKFKRDRELDELDHDLIKAKKEFDIAQEKNGTKNQQAINEQINNLQRIIDDSNETKQQMTTNYETAIQQRDEQSEMLTIEINRLNGEHFNIQQELKEQIIRHKNEREETLNIFKNEIKRLTDDKLVVEQERQAIINRLDEERLAKRELLDNYSQMGSILKKLVSSRQFTSEQIERLLDILKLNPKISVQMLYKSFSSEMPFTPFLDEINYLTSLGITENNNDRLSISEFGYLILNYIKTN